MIRLELDELEEQGYLEQPHHSAGRVPTNAGYEFFAKRMLGMNTPSSSSSGERGERAGANAAAKQNDLHLLLQDRAWPDLLAELSAQLGLLSVAADLARESVYKAGLQHLIDHLDWQDQSGIRSVIHDFEGVDERAPRAAGKMGASPQIFIGKKSPLTTSDNLSVVGGNFQIGDETISIFAIGPKRMDYKKVIRIFKNL
jgi:transcriptional regulator of heat shock response